MLQNLPPEVIRRMYTRGYLTEREMCIVARLIKDKMLEREFCKRKRNNRNKNSPPKTTASTSRRRTPIKAKRHWLK